MSKHTPEQIRAAHAEMEELDRLEAELDFGIRRRRLGPCPDVWRSPPSADRHYWLHAYNEKLELWADAADERVRELAAEAELFMPAVATDAPAAFLMAIGHAAYSLQGDPAKTNRANAANLAGLLDVTPRELKWLLDYIYLLAARLRRTNKDLSFGFRESLRIVAAVLAYDSAPAVMCPREPPLKDLS